jgi:hypothetical protein
MEKPAAGWVVGMLLLCLSWSFTTRDQPLLQSDLTLLSGDELSLSRLRYKKGLELIRILYEKILSLDHHFSGIRTEQYLRETGNPLAFTTFWEFAGEGKGKKSADIDKLACLLVFNMEVQSDLRLIAYETGFLTGANSQLLEECRELFAEYTRVIGYDLPLDQCRQADDWERVFRELDRHIEYIRQRQERRLPQETEQLLRDHINLEFSVDRLLNFLRNYQFHIQQGVLYYGKFKMILDSHLPAPPCAGGFPYQGVELRLAVEQALEAFHKAYQVPELKGSRLKDLLYGFSD